MVKLFGCVAPADRRYSGARGGSHNASVSHGMWSTAVLVIAGGSTPVPMKVPCKKIELLRNAARIRVALAKFVATILSTNDSIFGGVMSNTNRDK